MLQTLGINWLKYSITTVLSMDLKAISQSFIFLSRDF